MSTENPLSRRVQQRAYNFITAAPLQYNKSVTITRRTAQTQSKTSEVIIDPAGFLLAIVNHLEAKGL
jgi:hypothetical protein